MTSKILGFLLFAAVVASGCIANLPTPPVEDPLAQVIKPIAAKFTGADLEPLAFTTSDGITIRGTAYLPQGDPDGKHGVILQMSPYFSTAYGISTAQMLELPADWFGLEMLVAQGFAYVAASVPGTGESGGCFSIGGADERSRIAEFVDWLGERPWSNGNVGMMGVSYDGTTPWEAAVMAPKHLKTIVPMEGISDFYRYEYQDGAPYAYWGPLFYTNYYLDVGVGVYTILNGQVPPPDLLLEHACPIAADHFGESAATTASGTYDAFWAERNLTALFGDITASVLLVHGHADFNVKPDHANVWDLIPGEKKALWGQWPHAVPYDNYANQKWSRHDWNSTLVAWFDHYLNGAANGIPNALPNVSVQDSDGLWRNETAWPPTDVSSLRMHLAAGTLQAMPGSGADTIIPVPDPVGGSGYGPALLATGPDSVGPTMARYVSEPLTADLRVAGVPRLVANVSVDRAGNSHLIVQLYNVSASGQWNWMDEGGRGLAQRNGRERNDPVPAGTPLEVRVNLLPTESVFHKGERIGLIVAVEDSAWFFANGNEPVTTLWHNAQHGSTLELPVRPADAGLGFDSWKAALWNPYYTPDTLDRDAR